MDTSDAQLSSELQELYLENKETLSDILFLEDETRFFQKLFEKVLLSLMKGEKFQEIPLVNFSLVELKDRRDKLKIQLNAQQHLIEVLLKEPTRNIPISLIEQNAIITTEIKSLFRTDKAVKKDLYARVEQVLADHKAGHLLKA